MSFYSDAIVQHATYAWRAAVDAIPARYSRNHLLLGFLPRALFLPLSDLESHVYVIGPSKSGKTSRVLVPLQSQLIHMGQSTWTVDCKPDPMLWGHIDAEARAAGRRARLFSMQPGLPSEFSLDLFGALSLNPRTPRQIAQLLLGSLGLNEAAEPFFISQNLGALTRALEKAMPKGLSFQSIAKELSRIVNNEKLFPHAVHARDVLEDLADVAALNDKSGSLNTAELLESRDVCYFCLPVSTELKTSCATTAALLLKTTSLASKDLALAGRPTSRLHMAIDEFQDVATAGDLSDLLGQVRGVGSGISLILSHQVEEQVTDEALRALLKSSGLLVLMAPRPHAKLLQEWSGEKLDILMSEGMSRGPNGSTTTTTWQQVIRSTLDLNTIQEVNRLDGFGIVVASGGAPRPVFLPHHVEFPVAKQRGQAGFPVLAGRLPDSKSPRLTSARRGVVAGALGKAGVGKPGEGSSLGPSVREQIRSLFDELRTSVLLGGRRA